MKQYTCIVGLDPPEYNAIQARMDTPIIAHEILPKIIVKDGQLWVESDTSPRMLPVDKMVFHGIYENDLDFITGLALWGGKCLPNARAMMDCRLKFPCLVRALAVTQFAEPLRSYASPYARFSSDDERVAKWGNWHCGDNKERFTGVWSNENPVIIEPFLQGKAVRIAIIGDHTWQIQLDGNDWLKSIHHTDAKFMPIDDELLHDTHSLQQAFGLEIIANDYIVTEMGTKHLLEVNHIPNVTRFPEMWEAYLDYVVEWLKN